MMFLREIVGGGETMHKGIQLRILVFSFMFLLWKRSEMEVIESCSVESLSVRFIYSFHPFEQWQ